MATSTALRWVGVGVVAGVAFLAGVTRHAWWPTSPGVSASSDVAAGTAGFSAPFVDLGMQPWHSSVEFRAEFINRTARQVTIAAVKPSCDCTAIDTDEFVGREIGTGGRVRIKGRLDTGSQLGKRASEVTFLLNSGAVHTLRVRYEVMGTYRLQPERLVFDGIALDEDDGESESVQCALFSSKTAEITAQPKADVPWLDISTAARGDGVSELYFHIRKNQLSFGQSSAQVRIETNDPFKPILLVPVTVHATSSLRPAPAHVFLRPTESKRVRFLRRDGTAATLAQAETADTGLEIRLDADGGCIHISCHAAASREARVEVTDDTGRAASVLVSVMPE
jgi:hypothetical protein